MPSQNLENCAMNSETAYTFPSCAPPSLSSETKDPPPDKDSHQEPEMYLNASVVEYDSSSSTPRHAVTPQKVPLSPLTASPSPADDNAYESKFLIDSPNGAHRKRSKSMSLAPGRKLNIFALIRKERAHEALREEESRGSASQEVRVSNTLPWKQKSAPNSPCDDEDFMSATGRRLSVPMAATGPFYSNDSDSDDDRPLNLQDIVIASNGHDDDDTPPHLSPLSLSGSPKFTFNLNDREVVLRDEGDDADISTILKPSAHSVYAAAADDESESFRRIQHELDDRARRLQEYQDEASEYTDCSSDGNKIEMPTVSTYMERMVEGDEFYKENFEQTKFVLSHYTETPRFLRRPYILSSYRVQFSFRMCLHSLFRLHNETINIWTHFMSFIIMFLLEIITLVTVIVVGVMREHSTLIVIGDAMALSLYMTAACYCFFCSASYHTFKCKSKESYCTCYKMDISGVSNLIAASFIPGLWFQMRCHWILQTGYGLLVFIMGLIGTMMPFSCLFTTSVFESMRTVFFIGMILFSLLPSIHYTIVVLVQGTIDQSYFEFLCGFLVMVSLYAIGFFFWVTRIPERILPGKFDVFLASHQIWHVFISLASFVWWGVAVRMWFVKGLVRCW